MRWDRLFDDLEGQLEAAARLERQGEVADRTRRERAAIGLHERLLAHRGGHVTVRCGAGDRVAGRIEDVGVDWLMLDSAPGAVLVHLPAIRSVSGLPGRAEAPSAVARRFSIGMAVRVMSRDRVGVTVVDVTGTVLTGTVDAVGADYLELAEHPLDVPRRGENVRGLRVVPWAALSWIRRD